MKVTRWMRRARPVRGGNGARGNMGEVEVEVGEAAEVGEVGEVEVEVGEVTVDLGGADSNEGSRMGVVSKGARVTRPRVGVG